ncbi:phosphotransferase family protein [Nocardia sp. CS682]|uniref:phosphotransferase family protein n=1 Tax=Nocardia sp. CS682 TaxID=1047172 RepID=UPI0010757A60|nr:aminoglycoside phosphotransferase family protein [Nocardia sp. CS682]QBS46129.1 viomycin phosphotransferase [Nocardia sp. CS682]
MTGLIEAHGELLERLLPGDRLSEVTIREGQFHYVVVGSERVVRFARTDAAAHRLPACAAALRALAHIDLGGAVPECLTVGTPRDAATPATPAAAGLATATYLVMTKVAGAPLDVESLRDSAVAESVARHCHDLLGKLAAAGTDPRIRASLPAASLDRWRAFADGVRTELYPLMHGSGRERAERELSALGSLPHLTSAVVHGDLGGDNLLWDNVDGLPVLRGVVDWDGVCLGDPAEDFAAIGGYGADVLRGVLALTDSSDSDLGARIATIQGTFALQQALDAYRDGDDEELADGLTGYR